MNQDRLLEVAPDAGPARRQAGPAPTVHPLTAARPWRLDERTRQLGRRGVAQAREALREARASHRPLDHAA